MIAEFADFGSSVGGLSLVVNLRKRPEGNLDFKGCGL